MSRALRLLAQSTLVSLAGCGGYASHVQTDDFALGRVVVYRNGIAYYERRTQAVDDQLTLTVPQDKVDDFLKSLTVAEAETGRTVPVSYPTRGATRGDDVDMTVALPPGTRGDLLLTYITDAPAWKPSYRVVVDDERVRVQGWAIVDNTSGEDWRQVRVGVGASSALSFRYDLRSVVHVHRDLLGGQKAFAVAPPTGGAIHSGPTSSEEGKVVLALDATQLAPGDADEEAGGDPLGAVAGMTSPAAVGAGDGVGRGVAAKSAAEDRAGARAARAEAMDARLQGLARQLRERRDRVTVEGFAQAGESEHVAADRANHVRNRLVELGVAPDRVAIAPRGVVAGRAGGVELKVVEAPAAAEPESAGTPVGESHFESGVPMTIARGTSAMVAVLDAPAEGEVVYLYAPDGERGDARYAFKAVRFKNPTASTLEAGPVTVYGEARFIGEGLTDGIPPAATALVPFALDRQVIVDRQESTRDRIERIQRIDRGHLTAEVRHTRRTELTVTHRGHQKARVFLRHRLPDGWTLGDAPRVYEVQGEARLFAVELNPGERQTVALEAHTPLTRTVDLRTPAGVDLLRAHVASKPADGDFARAAEDVLHQHDAMNAAVERIASLQAQATTLQERTAELTLQVRALAGSRGGEKLRRHLEGKLADLANRQQAVTVQVVDQQEALMLARIRFQDAVAELTVGSPAVALAR